ncbi:hypothetical protein ACHAQH_008312 [Verticillium albo-atrum]
MMPLADLRETDPRDDKIHIEETKGGLLEDSCRCILDHRDGRDDPQSRLLWIKDDPGKGKTMLLCGLINEPEIAPTGKYQLASFFCQATDDRRNSETAVLRDLLYFARLSASSSRLLPARKVQARRQASFR